MSCLIGVAGPSTSGKSTLCKKLIEELDNSLLISLDHYWYDSSSFPMAYGFKNWDLPENLDLDLLFQNLSDLKNGVETNIPNFVNYKCEGLKTVQPADFVIAEGFLLFYDERISDLLDLRIFLDISEEVILERRIKRNRFGKKKRELYYRNVVIKEYNRHASVQRIRSHRILDGTKDLDFNKKNIIDMIRN